MNVMKKLFLILLLFLVSCRSVPAPPEQPQLTDEQIEILKRHVQFMEVSQVFEQCILIQIVSATVDNEPIDRGTVRTDCYVLTVKRFPWILETTETEENRLQDIFDNLMNSIK
jgi:hypothetical protein